MNPVEIFIGNSLDRLSAKKLNSCALFDGIKHKIRAIAIIGTASRVTTPSHARSTAICRKPSVPISNGNLLTILGEMAMPFKPNIEPHIDKASDIEFALKNTHENATVKKVIAQEKGR